MKIALIGPVYPYRGGIAHYTTMLYNALRDRKHSVLMISFKRQYPRWLFPGRSDKDPSEHPLLVKDAQYWIDSINPISWLTTFYRIQQYQPDILILQWWTTFWTPSFFTLLYLYRHAFSQSPVIMFIHNIVPHENRPWDSLFSQIVLSLSTHHFVHSEQDRDSLLRLVPHAQVLTINFPPYHGIIPQKYPKHVARSLIGISADSKVILFFGLVRPYKGLKYLLQAMPHLLHDIPSLQLLIVGEFWENKRKYTNQIERLGLSNHVVIIDRYIRNEEISLYFNAANVLILPYLHTSHSAVLQIAFETGLPVIASNVGGLRESIKNGVNGLLVKPGDSSSLTQAITYYFQKELEPIMRDNITKARNVTSWDNVVKHIESIFQERGKHGNT